MADKKIIDMDDLMSNGASIDSLVSLPNAPDDANDWKHKTGGALSAPVSTAADDLDVSSVDLSGLDPVREDYAQRNNGGADRFAYGGGNSAPQYAEPAQPAQPAPSQPSYNQGVADIMSKYSGGFEVGTTSAAPAAPAPMAPTTPPDLSAAATSGIDFDLPPIRRVTIPETLSEAIEANKAAENGLPPLPQTAAPSADTGYASPYGAAQTGYDNGLPPLHQPAAPSADTGYAPPYGAAQTGYDNGLPPLHQPAAPSADTGYAPPYGAAQTGYDNGLPPLHQPAQPVQTGYGGGLPPLPQAPQPVQTNFDSGLPPLHQPPQTGLDNGLPPLKPVTVPNAGAPAGMSAPEAQAGAERIAVTIPGMGNNAPSSDGDLPPLKPIPKEEDEEKEEKPEEKPESETVEEDGTFIFEAPNRDDGEALPADMSDVQAPKLDDMMAIPTKKSSFERPENKIEGMDDPFAKNMSAARRKKLEEGFDDPVTMKSPDPSTYREIEENERMERAERGKKTLGTLPIFFAVTGILAIVGDVLLKGNLMLGGISCGLAVLGAVILAKGPSGAMRILFAVMGIASVFLGFLGIDFFTLIGSLGGASVMSLAAVITAALHAACFIIVTLISFANKNIGEYYRSLKEDN